MTQPVPNGSVTSTAIANSTANLRTFSHVVGTLTNGATVLGVIGTDGSGGTNTYTAATINGISYSAVASAVSGQANNDGSKTVIAFYVLTALGGLTAGTHTVNITSSGATPLTGAFAANFDNVNQTTPATGGANSGSGTPDAAPTQPIASSTNDLAIGCCGAYDAGGAITPGNTQLGTRITDGIFSAISFVLEYASTLNPTLTWTLTTLGTGGNGQAGFSLNGTSAAPAIEGSRRKRSKPHPGKRGPAEGLGHFYRSRRNTFTNPDVTVALTGVAGTGSVGTLAPATSVATTGNAATSSVGTTVPSTTVGVTGNAGTSAVGSVSAQSAAIVGSRRRSMSAGPAVNPYNLRKFYQSPRNKFSVPNITVALTGVAGTGSPGTLAPSASVPVTGNAAAAAIGALVAAPSIAVIGNAATGSVGTLAPASVVPLTSASATGGTGTVSPQQAGSAAISGVSATSAPGTAAPSTAVAVTGVQATGAAGTVGQSRTVALSGVAATGVAGSVNATNDIVVALSGVSATGSAGSMTSSRTRSLSGNSTTASPGSVTPSGSSVFELGNSSVWRVPAKPRAWHLKRLGNADA